MHVIILAAGKGGRLLPYTWDRPKALVHVYGKALIEHQFDWLKSHGVTDITLVEDENNAKIPEYVRLTDHLGDGKKYGVNLSYLDVSHLPPGDGIHIRHALQSMNDTSPVVVVACDILTNCDITKLVDFHTQYHKTITLFAAEQPIHLGIIHAGKPHEGVTFLQKPKMLVNSSVYVFNPEIAESIDDEGLVESIMKLPKENIGAYQEPDAYWFHISEVHDDVRLADESFQRMNRQKTSTS